MSDHNRSLQERIDPAPVIIKRQQPETDFKVDVADPNIILIGGSNGKTNHNLYVYDYRREVIIKSVNTEKPIFNMSFSLKALYLFLNYGGMNGIRILNKFSLIKAKEDINRGGSTIIMEGTRSCLYTLDDFQNAIIRIGLKNFEGRISIKFPEKELVGDFATHMVRIPNHNLFLVAFPYSSKRKKGLIRQINLESLKVKEFFIEGCPRQLAFTREGQLIIGHEDSVSLHHPDTLKILKENLPVGRSPRIAITPTGKQIVVASFEGTISVINLHNWTKQIPDIQIGQECWEIKVHPAGNCLFIATGKDVLIKMDLSTWKITTYKLGFEVKCIAIYLPPQTFQNTIQHQILSNMKNFLDVSILTL